MFSSLLKKQMMRAGFLLLVSSFLLYSPAQAAPIEKVEVSLDAAGGDLPPAVEKRVVSSISSIGNRVFVGKEENLFALNSSAYDKVLADIINRVVIGYVVWAPFSRWGRSSAMWIQKSITAAFRRKQPAMWQRIRPMCRLSWRTFSLGFP